jgi:hypothetical protein
VMLGFDWLAVLYEVLLLMSAISMSTAMTAYTMLSHMNAS